MSAHRKGISSRLSYVIGSNENDGGEVEGRYDDFDDGDIFSGAFFLEASIVVMIDSMKCSPHESQDLYTEQRLETIKEMEKANIYSQ